jgi:hypothetical protein
MSERRQWNKERWDEEAKLRVQPAKIKGFCHIVTASVKRSLSP